MEHLNSKYIIKIPSQTKVLYCDKKNIITIIGVLTKKSVKLNLKLKVFNDKKTIFVTSISTFNISNNKKKHIKSVQGTTTALLKQLILESSNIFFKKLKLVGVGYKAFYVDNFESQLLLFKLGFSHSIYFKIPVALNFFCLKQTKLFVFGNFYQNITQLAANIQLCKLPEPYKGKGILDENKKIQLKEGKKT